MTPLRQPFTATLGLLALGLAAGCTLPPQPAEKTARSELRSTGAALLPSHGRPALPVLNADSPLQDYIRYSVLNHPSVAAAYYDWRAAVEEIAPNRAQPEPQLTLEADIADTLMTFMPGVMFDFMGAGKRAAMARESTAAAEVTHRAFIVAVLNAAAETRKAWVELAYLEDTDRLYATTIHVVDESLALVNAEYVTGRGMGTLEKQLRLQNLAAEHHAHHAGLADRLVAAHSRLKSALGLLPSEPDPAWPHPSLSATPLPTADELWQRAQTVNPELGKMRAMVEMTVAGVEVARKAGRPGFTLGAMADLKADPLMVRPTATLTLPIWREKIAATIAAAEARREAAIARVDAEQLNLAAELAQMLYMVRESDRMLGYIDGTALPNIERSYATLEAGAQSGMTNAAMIPETRLMALDMRHERVETLRQRETAVVDLSLMIADVAPLDSSLLTR
jgi:outer membrane protein TolC